MEFLYTRQQMEGFKGYQCKVKIGNWSEDMDLEAVSLTVMCAPVPSADERTVPDHFLIYSEEALMLRCFKISRGRGWVMRTAEVLMCIDNPIDAHFLLVLG